MMSHRRLDEDWRLRDWEASARLELLSIVRSHLIHRMRSLSVAGRTFSAQRKDFDSAIADYSAIIEFDPRSISAYVNRGNAYLQQRHLDKALADYDAVQRIDATAPAAYRGQGHVYELRGQIHLARRSYEQGLKLAPTDVWLRQALVRLSRKRQ